MKSGNQVEIHSKNAGYQGRREENNTENSKYLDNLILLQCD
jgi:hypothetical protein